MINYSCYYPKNVIIICGGVKMNEFENIFSLIHNQEKLSIDYNQFKDILIKYAEQIMKSFLDGKANCIIRVLAWQ